jgi:hypothetical protein
VHIRHIEDGEPGRLTRDPRGHQDADLERIADSFRGEPEALDLGDLDQLLGQGHMAAEGLGKQETTGEQSLASRSHCGSGLKVRFFQHRTYQGTGFMLRSVVALALLGST